MWSYRKDTGGCDHWVRDEIKLILTVARQSTADSSTLACSHFVTPSKNSCNLHAVLGKPVGERTILKSPMSYRFVNNICCYEVVQWDVPNADEFDQARKGSSALFAATQICDVTEVEVALGSFASCALHDYNIFRFE